jgi:hypothetical protein
MRKGHQVQDNQVKRWEQRGATRAICWVLVTLSWLASQADRPDKPVSVGVNLLNAQQWGTPSMEWPRAQRTAARSMHTDGISTSIAGPACMLAAVRDSGQRQRMQLVTAYTRLCTTKQQKCMHACVLVRGCHNKSSQKQEQGCHADERCWSSAWIQHCSSGRHDRRPGNGRHALEETM